MSDDSTQAAAPKKKSKALLFIVLGVVLVAGGAGGFLVMKSKKDGEEGGAAKHAAKPAKPPVFVPMEDFLVNLPGQGGGHFLQAKVVLRTADNVSEAKIKSMIPLIRDRMLMVMSRRPMEVLATAEGKAQMTREMALVINALIDPELTALYALSRDPGEEEMRNLERLGVIPREGHGGAKMTGRSAAQLANLSEMDLPVQAVLFSSFVMQ